MNIKVFASFVVATVLLCGCVTEVVVPEVLQQPIDSKVYLAYNVWYQNPNEVSCLNIQTGRVLPIGSEVTPLSASEKHVTFVDANGVEFTILFDAESMMIPVQEYIRRLFTLKSADELLKDLPAEHQEKILAAQILPKMSKEEVILAYGYPAAGRTPSLQNSSYLYYLTPKKVLYVLFQGDEVRKVMTP